MTRRLTRILAAGCLLSITGTAGAQDQDPLHSAACGQARERLESALDDASARREGSRERLAARRQEAMEACLGRFEGRAGRAGAPEPAIVVAPTMALPRGERSIAGPAAPVAPPLAFPRPAAITTCDPAGCWDSEGRRLNAHGPLLIGPRGPCVVQGGVVQCP